ncbi:lysine--tRNA ligase [Candidatus Woesearchaeota archaeon]|nr:lysine--tRNA ligase [Candidatus Woesearchaeota archaeon]
MGKKVMHWADSTAKRIFQQKGKKDKYTLAAGITPSGTIHLGNFREIITVDLIDKALKDLGHKTRFIYSWDDYDVFRKVPKNMPKHDVLKEHLRMSLVEVPDIVDEEHENYAKHNEKQVEKELPGLNINPEFIYQAEMNKKCSYAELIKTALDNIDKIKDILNEHRSDDLTEEWLPVSVYCEKCKKEAAKVGHSDSYELEYECSCGNKSSFDLRKKGLAKLKWRVDWPARWKYENVDFESGGKDHFAAGGSFATGKRIVKEVYGRDEPASMRYEWISLKGKGQFASSSGNVITLAEMKDIYEPSIIRWLFASTRPDAEFEISFDLDVLTIYESFDRCERIYFDKEENISEKEKEKQKRIYELSAVKIPKELPYQPGFRHLTTVLQIFEKDLNETEKFFSDFFKTEEDKKRFKVRAKCALNWLEKYAPEDFKFKVQKEVPKDIELSEKQKESLKKAAEVLSKDIKDDEKLHEEFYNIFKSMDMGAKDFFKGAYKVLIGKEKGPRLAHFILTIGKDKVKNLFEQI